MHRPSHSPYLDECPYPWHDPHDPSSHHRCTAASHFANQTAVYPAFTPTLWRDAGLSWSAERVCSRTRRQVPHDRHSRLQLPHALE